MLTKLSQQNNAVKTMALTLNDYNCPGTFLEFEGSLGVRELSELPLPASLLAQEDKIT
jgi:hypothetical protein